MNIFLSPKIALNVKCLPLYMNVAFTWKIFLSSQLFLAVQILVEIAHALNKFS